MDGDYEPLERDEVLETCAKKYACPATRVTARYRANFGALEIGTTSAPMRLSMNAHAMIREEYLVTSRRISDRERERE